MSEIKRLVLDVLKPHSPSIIDVANRLAAVRGVSGVNCVVNEIDQETENLKITILGPNIDFDAIKRALEELGGAIHSIDSVSSGRILVDEVETPQD